MRLRLVTSWFLFCCFLFIVGSVIAQSDPPSDPRPMPSPPPQTREYAPDRIIVKYKEGSSKEDIRKKVQERIEERKTPLGRFRLQAADVAEYGLRDRPEDRLADIEAVERQLQLKTEPIAPAISEDVVIAKKTNEGTLDVDQAVREFERLPEVEYAEPDYKRTALFTPNDPFYPDQWMFSKVNAPAAWDLSRGSTDIVIAVLDTGIYASHPDLSGKVTLQVDCARDTGCVSGGIADHWHGTAVGGIASALTHNASGISGTGFDTPLYSFKVLDNTGNGYVSWMLQALQYLVQLNNGKKIIVNMSLGGPDSSAGEESVINSAWNDGMLLVASAGNDNVSTIFYPAGYTNVLSVGALNNANQKSSYSNYGMWVDVTAPGGDCAGSYTILTCLVSAGYFYGDTEPVGYVLTDGTSFSAPVVSGIASLVWGRNPSLTNTQVRNILQSTASAISGTGTSWRYGLVNAQAAVSAVTPINPTATLTPTRTPTPTATRTPTPTNTPIPPQPGDADGDTDVDIFDYNIVISHFGQTVTGTSNGDLDGDGDVDIFDYNLVISNFGR